MHPEHREWFVAQLDAEAKRTRRALEHVPTGKEDWTPHPRSMSLGRLARLVSGMPGWISLVINQDHLELNPPAGQSNMGQPPAVTPEALVQAHDDGVTGARAALRATTEEHLAKDWKLMMSGKVVSSDSRLDVLRDTFMHLAHHRGQLTVYLRLAGGTVPALYGPSADDARWS
jgi:uncharacterized damage-inducible protein DinB